MHSPQMTGRAATHGDNEVIAVAGFYRFADLSNYRTLREPLLELCTAADLMGTILLAPEGVNGAVAGRRADIESLLAHLRSIPALSDLPVRWSRASTAPFRRMKVRLRRELVGLGLAGIAPQRGTGRRVGAHEWNALLADPDVLVIDTRNAYEHRIGSFPGAISPGTSNFNEFPAWAESALDPAEHGRIAMFCTGGIRCEKASAYLLERGFADVAQLEGGIVQYIADLAPEASQWRGECFVFDSRVALNGRLDAGEHTLCRACREPLSAGDRASPAYVAGVSCPYCLNRTSASQRRGFAERRHQVELAERRGEAHVGAVMEDATRRNRGD